MCTGTNFSEGWMCPIYKKKDRTDISNYRPITVLNADYKIMTRTMAMRLATAAPSVIHKDQAGFMKGRHIEDHTDLVNAMISKCKLTEDNGVIIFLDQEKAYDKIRHDFLWKTLAHLNFPARFINMLKAIYSDAFTQIIINGVIGRAFRITRGVRQGDPISCLLFNLAIESLACMLRASPLTGFGIKGLSEKLIATLFADDTTVYLSEDDSYAALEEILNKWCTISGARFNIEKTEILPVGSPEYRAKMHKTRKLNNTDTAVAPNIRILKDGDHARVLGAYVGNKINEISIWTPIMEKIDTNLKRWAKGNPTQEGRRLVVNMEVGGHTQYLTRVQGMPANVLTKLTARISSFMWDGTRPTINFETLQAPFERGGRRLLDLAARNEAIELRKYQQYCKIGNERPRWAYVADEIMETNIGEYSPILDDASISNLPLQKTALAPGSRIAPLPKKMIRMLQTKKKYNVVFDPPAIDKNLRRELPLWYHISGIQNTTNTQNNDTPTTRSVNWANLKEATCLRQYHLVVTVGDAISAAEPLQSTRHKARRNCICDACKKYCCRGCENPHLCMMKARKIIAALPTRFRPATEGPQPKAHTQDTNIIIPPNAIRFDKNVSISSFTEQAL